MLRARGPELAQPTQLWRVGAHNSVVGADQGLRAPSWDQESVRDSVHEDSASPRIAARQRPRPSFRHPQGLLVAMSMMRRRTEAAVDGRPSARQGWVQWRAIRRRCQRSRVSRVTSQPARCGRGRAAVMAPSRARSSSASACRLFRRCSTVSWWRRTMISRSFERPERTAKRANDTRNRHRTRHMRSQESVRDSVHEDSASAPWRQVNDHGRVGGATR